MKKMLKFFYTLPFPPNLNIQTVHHYKRAF